MKQETLRMRVDATHEAQKRTRLAFFALSIVSLAFIICAWNAYMSWDRHFLTMPTFDGDVKDGVTAHAQREAIAEFVKNTIFSVPVLGIRVAISDAAVLGSVSLSVLTLWFVLCLRRENHTMARVLRDTSSESIEVRGYVFHGIASSLVFTDYGDSEYPIDKLSPEIPQPSPRIRLAGSFQFLIFLPFFATAGIIFADVATIFWINAAFRSPHDPLIKLSEIPWVIVVVYELVAAVMATFILILCWRALKFERASGAILREYAKDLGIVPPLRHPRTKKDPKGSGGA